MPTDKELLELAAKAAGIKGVNFDRARRDWGWNPLDDDGDALRLAVKLGMCIDWVDGSMMVEFFVKDKIKHIGIEIYTDDPYAATRRAIVRAAAEIGKNK